MAARADSVDEIAGLERFQPRPAGAFPMQHEIDGQRARLRIVRTDGVVAARNTIGRRDFQHHILPARPDEFVQIGAGEFHPHHARRDLLLCCDRKRPHAPAFAGDEVSDRSQKAGVLFLPVH